MPRSKLPLEGVSSSRPIRPATDLLPQPDIESEVPKKRRYTLAPGGACNRCRTRKTACDGERPACKVCEKRHLYCQYTTMEGETPSTSMKRELQTLREQMFDLTTFLSILKDAPQLEVDAMLERLRTNPDSMLVAQLYRGGNPISYYRPSEQITNENWLPGLDSVIEARLIREHPIAYPIPNEASNQILLTALLSIGQQPLDSLTTGLRHQETMALGTGSSHSNVIVQSTKFGDHHHQGSSSGVSHAGAAQMSLDQSDSVPDLDQLDISFWSSVPVSNQFAADIISLFLSTDHPILGLFHPREFLTSLVDCDHTSCSAFLVNALLSFACQAYAAKDPKAASLSWQFEEEAEILWRAEKDSDSAKSIAGLILLVAAMGAHDEWPKVREFLPDIKNFASQRGLINCIEGLSCEEIEKLSIGERNALEYIAWGTYNFLNMEAIFYITDPPKRPPVVRESASDPGMTRIKLLDVPTDATPTFKAFCSLSVITSQVLQVYHAEEGRRIPLAFALSKYDALLCFADSLPVETTFVEGCPGHVIIFHIWFHALILDIFRPFVLWGAPLSDAANTPEGISGASLNQLKRLMLLYQTQYQASSPTILWHPCLVFVANSLVSRPKALSTHAYFLACIRAYAFATLSGTTATKTIKGLLTMAVESNIITLPQARDLAQHAATIIKTSAEKAAVPRNSAAFTNSAVVLDLNSGLDNRAASRLDELSARFEEMNAFHEYTNDVL